MSLTTCSIIITQQSDKVITVSRSLSRALQISSSHSITLKLGNKTITAPVKIWNREGHVMAIPHSLSSQLYLPYSGKCLVKSSNGRNIQLGPLIGILTGPAANNSSVPFGGRTGFLREFMQAGSNKAYYFAFAANQVDWNREVVTGYFPDSNGKWIRRTVPLPDVVYNRLPSRRAENSSAMSLFKTKFVNRKIPLFNWSFFDKWDVYRLLDGEQEAAKHVPESIHNPKADEIQRMMEKHRFVYLKPSAGSLGIGIYRLTYTPNRGYFARFRRNGINVLIRFPRFDSLFRMLQQHNLKLQHYVLQQGVRLIELENCPIDFRFHLTKNGSNHWVASGIGAKKAGKGSVTTHVRSGGMLMMPEQVLKSVFGSRGEQVLENAKSVAIKLAEAIERNYSHTLGELGFDLGIDQNERVWMFEANAKPGRSIFKHPSLKSQGRTSLVNLFEHCLYLSRFRVRRES
ncbi:MAG: YheC/YheD family protein [Paenibacillaceae bacterium]